MYGNVITYNDVIVVGIHGNIDALESGCLFWMQQVEGSEVNAKFFCILINFQQHVKKKMSSTTNNVL